MTDEQIAEIEDLRDSLTQDRAMTISQRVELATPIWRAIPDLIAALRAERAEVARLKAENADLLERVNDDALVQVEWVRVKVNNGDVKVIDRSPVRSLDAAESDRGGV